ncbi:MAG: hypothetical protein Q4Q53_08220 [Methanocorpusculum sp.]|nr:hypothetical protein [Methanocorpusculum sp.]
MLVSAVSALTTEVGKADDHVRFALLAFHPEMAGGVRKNPVYGIIAVGTV